MTAVGKQAPEYEVSTWVQGVPRTLAELRGKVVLVDVFQVNCPGCFLFNLPQARLPFVLLLYIYLILCMYYILFSVLYLLFS